MSSNIMYNIYDIHLNYNTHAFDGLEWVVDGERGRDTFPGTWEKEKVIRYYRRGWSWYHVEA